MKRTWALRLAGWLVLATLTGCAGPSVHPDPPELGRTPWAIRSVVGAASTDAATPAWFHQALPGKTPVKYSYERRHGRDAVAAVADGAVSLVRQRVRIESAGLGALRFSWMVPELIGGADLGRPEAADSPVRIVLAFDGDRSRLAARDVLLSELIHAVTGEPMPYATLMYVWCEQQPPGSVIEQPRTGRIRSLVLESGRTRLNRWLDYERDIRADYRQVFGEEPGALIGVAIMSDSDNTGSAVRAWYGPVELLPAD